MSKVGLSVLAIVVAFATGVVHGNKKCKLPTPQVIDWNRVSGNWFNILNRATPGDKVVKCLQLRDFRQLKNGFSYVKEDYHLYSGTHEGVNVVFKQKKPGVFAIRKENYKKWMKIVKKDVRYSSMALVKPTMKEAKELRTSTAVFYTDYKHYLIDFRCAKNGNKYIWIMSKNPNPTAKDVLRITNKLASIGNGWNTFQLYLSGCATTRYDLSLFERDQW